jgi:hypothetical protein
MIPLPCFRVMHSAGRGLLSALALTDIANYNGCPLVFILIGGVVTTALFFVVIPHARGGPTIIPLATVPILLCVASAYT